MQKSSGPKILRYTFTGRNKVSFFVWFLMVYPSSSVYFEDIVTSLVMQLKWSWGAPDPEPEKSWWALLIEAGELVGEWFCQGFVLFCLRYMSLNELGFWKKYINLTVDVQDVKSRQVGLAITSTFRRGKGCLSEGHLQGETKQGSSICDIMRSCRKSERHKSCQIVFQQIKWSSDMSNWISLTSLTKQRRRWQLH